MGERVYIVQRFEWEYSDEWFYPHNDTPLKAFRLRETAELYRRKLEDEARRQISTSSPEVDSGWSSNLGFTFGGLQHMTTLPEAAFRERLREIGLPDLPQSATRNGIDYGQEWSDDWWKAVWASLSPEHWDGFWQLLDLVRFYQVVEVEMPS